MSRDGLRVSQGGEKMAQAPAFGARTLTDLATWLLDLATSATEMQNLGRQLWHVAFGSAPAAHFRKSALEVLRKMKCIETGKRQVSFQQSHGGFSMLFLAFSNVQVTCQRERVVILTALTASTVHEFWCTEALVNASNKWTVPIATASAEARATLTFARRKDGCPASQLNPLWSDRQSVRVGTPVAGMRVCLSTIQIIQYPSGTVWHCLHF